MENRFQKISVFFTKPDSQSAPGVPKTNIFLFYRQLHKL